MMMYEDINKLIDKTISKLKIEALYVDRGEYEDIIKENIYNSIDDLRAAKSRLADIDHILKHGLDD